MPIISGTTPRVLFTERSRHLARHAGQVSFPGGRADDTDVSLVQTALRETHEETGIEPTFVTVAGFLDTYETGSGYAILPVVGVLSEGFALRPGAAEVERIFEVPLAYLLDPKNREQGHGQWQGHKRTYYTYHYAGHRIWGATAAMVVNFAERFGR
jgi:8-oxo-dGTP pyrophosphatase MutT (NUDIX family)